MRFDAVAFDLDGTLYPSYRLYARAFPSMLGKARFLAAFSRTRRELRASGLDAIQRATPAAAVGTQMAARAADPGAGPAFRARQAELLSRRLGIEVGEAVELIDRDFYRGVEELFSKVPPFGGLKRALDEIAASGRRLALLSDLPPARKLELLGLSDRFECALCSEDSGFLKPAREPFAMLAERLGIRPERILYVGNNPSIDVAGAKMAGMAAAIVTLRRVKSADLCFWDWRKLAEFATS